MAYDSNGNYSPPNPPTFPAVAGTTVSSSYFNSVVLDIAAALTIATHFTPAGGTAINRLVQDKLRETISVTDNGADITGTNDSLASFVGAFALTGTLVAPAVSSSYKLSGNWTPPTKDAVIRMDANVVFTGSHPDFNNLIPYEAVPGTLFSLNLIRKTYGVEWTGQGQIFQTAYYAIANIATIPIVALFSAGEASAAGSHAWGLNTGCYCGSPTGTAISYELNCGVLPAGAGGLSYGLVIASSGGGGQPQNAIQIDANNTASQFIDGLYIHFSETTARGCITGSVFNIAGGSGAASTCQRFLYAHGTVATVAELEFPSLLVDPTVVGGTVNRLRVKGGGAGVPPLLLPAGETNSGLNLAPRGTGVMGLYDGGLTLKIAISSVGLGFFAASPVAKQTVAAVATDLATAITLANSMRTGFLAYGLF